MTPSRCHRQKEAPSGRPGFLLLDILLGVSVFSIFIGFSGASLLYSQRIAINSGDRIRGSFLSQQSTEAVRSIRDKDFEDLQEGEFGVQVGEDGLWELVSFPVVSGDGFRTKVDITFPSDDRAQVTATTSWVFGTQRFGTSSLVTTLTNWRVVREIGNWASVSLEGSFIDETPPLFNSVALSGDYAFVTSETSAGGAGLYVFDISNLASPQRVADGFALGSAGYQLVVNGEVLFVVTAAVGSEIQAFDISSPDTLSIDDRVGTYDLPGEARGRSVALFGDALFVGATESATDDEFFSLDITDPANIFLLDSVNDEGGYLDISLHSGYAYIGSSKDVSELIVADVFDPSDISITAGSGYNLTDVLDGQAVAAFGVRVIIGRAYGDVTQEFVLFDIEESPVPSPPPGPWYHGIGANVTAIDVDPTGTYAFVSSDFDNQELQVVDITLLEDGQMPRVETVGTDTGVGRSVTYDPLKDRVFLTTNTALLIYKPAP